MLKYFYFKYYYQSIVDFDDYQYRDFLFSNYFLVLLNSFVSLSKHTKLTLNRTSNSCIRVNNNPELNILKLLKNKFLFLFLIVLANINSVSAISSITVGEIRGSLPYITFDGGKTKITKLSSLLVMGNPDGRFFIPEKDEIMLFPNSIVDSSDAREPIEVPVSASWKDIVTLVPLNSGNGSNSTIDLKTLLVSEGHLQDDDGDGNFDATGNLTLTWQDSSGKDISEMIKADPDEKLDPCDSPYRLTIAVTNSDISTQYGVPRVGNNLGISHTYYLRPKITQPYVCYARPPDITNDSTSGSGLPDLNGSEWVAGKGFKPQDIYYPPKNFPTMAANNLLFDLVIAGLTAQQVLEGYGNGIIEGVSFEDNTPPKDGRQNIDGRQNEVPRQYAYRTFFYYNLQAKLSLAPNQDINTGNKLRITLIGKHDDDKNAIYTNGSAFYIDYKVTNTRLYSFKIKKWFRLVNRGNNIPCLRFLSSNRDNVTTAKHPVYTEPDISDLTNANAFTWNGGIFGRNINNYRRQISSYSPYIIKRPTYGPVREYWGLKTINGGLFSEWGYMYEGEYPGTDWTSGHYITSNEYANKKYYSVASYDGHILQGSETRRACVFNGAIF